MLGCDIHDVSFFLLYKTHVMKMDPGEKTITLSPVQKVSSGMTEKEE